MSTIATHIQEKNHVVRERVFPPSEFERVMMMVSESRLTGTIMLDCAQGGVCNIRVVEEQKVTFPKDSP
jgi:hypothetical protein